jgi:hypothetical protein
VYRNKNKKYQNISLEYRQKTYNFDHDKPVVYSNPFELVYFEITSDVIAMMKDIILDSEKILNIPSIPDPHGIRFSNKDTFWPILS